MNRRDFLSVGAVPLAAAAAGSGGADERRRDAAQRARDSRQAQEVVRVGLIGAGANVQDVQIPGFREIQGVEILAVANRSLGSSQRVADQFGIPRAYGHWGELLADDDVDAVLIGTWPYMHRTLTLEALEHGKHVLCQARMANDAAEAREMLDASLRQPDLICQLVPTSTSYVIDNVLKRLINEGHLGEVISVEIQRCGRGFPDFGGELDWRHDRQFSGHNTLNIGSTYESMMRWLGRGSRVIAMSSIHVPYRRDATGTPASVSIPDHLDILYELANGAQVHMRMSETTGLSAGNATWIHGTEGTAHVDARMNVFAGRRGDASLSQVPNPPEGQAFYRVEEEFVNAIRGIEEVTQLTFEAGAHYMEWTEAVHRSAQTGQAVHLPL
ncbi:MAG TPA: Gfo/Idh/MocA family oxidoreductase [Longimicrobiales bacterium]|nr:Gfo/Idh/MocA family oxidoreductase [Longimicrobiales bacterium]